MNLDPFYVDSDVLKLVGIKLEVRFTKPLRFRLWLALKLAHVIAWLCKTEVDEQVQVFTCADIFDAFGRGAHEMSQHILTKGVDRAMLLHKAADDYTKRAYDLKAGKKDG